MLRLIEVDHSPAGRATAAVTLSFADRRRSRLPVRLDDGREAALFLPRGTVLRDGDRLRSDPEGMLVEVRAAAETLSVARTPDLHLLARAAYHLGNRHVPVQLGAGFLAYEHDHVLDDLVRQLGLAVAVEVIPFEPEAGGYGAHGHGGGGHRHGHGHDHGHDHDHGHNHLGGHGHTHDHER